MKKIEYNDPVYEYWYYSPGVFKKFRMDDNRANRVPIPVSPTSGIYEVLQGLVDAGKFVGAVVVENIAPVKVIRQELKEPPVVVLRAVGKLLKRVGSDDMKELVALYGSGQSSRVLAARYGVSNNTIMKYVAAAGVIQRNKPGRKGKSL